MKAIVLTAKTAARYAKPCPSCHRKAKAGEAVLALSIDDVSFNARNLAIHVTCVAKAIDKVPAEGAQAFENLRTLMLEQGTPFPVRPAVQPDRVAAGRR